MIGLLGEPFPALWMPGFGGAGGYEDGEINVSRPVILFLFDDGHRIELTQREFLEELPDSRHGFIMHNCFPAAEQRRGKGRIAKVMPGYRYGVRHRMRPKNLASLREWLEHRAHKLEPHQTLKRVEVEWLTDTYRVVSESVLRSSVSAGSYVIEIAGGEQ